MSAERKEGFDHTVIGTHLPVKHIIPSYSQCLSNKLSNASARKMRGERWRNLPTWIRSTIRSSIILLLVMSHDLSSQNLEYACALIRNVSHVVMIRTATQPALPRTPPPSQSWLPRSLPSWVPTTAPRMIK